MASMTDKNPKPERLPLNTSDLTESLLAQLRNTAPQVFREGKVDFAKLQAALGNHIDGDPERYGLNWAGKRDAFRNVQVPSVATLRPQFEESINWETTENLIIEGDNLEVLKLLQKPYHSKVKTIYIDPPYNTGNEFIYPDNYREGLEEYLRYTGQLSEDGTAVSTNKDTSGRYHSNWLNMMYPRLFLARNLLREDGIIFVSIDDHEVSNLRLLMNEIFGEENFVVNILWKKRSTPPNDQIIGTNHDYILCFARDINLLALNLRARTDEQIARYKNPDNHPKGPWTAGDLMANVKGGRYVASLNFAIINPLTGEEHYPSNNGNWRFNRAKVEELIKNNEIYFGEDGKGRPKLKRFLSDVKKGISYPSIWDFVSLNTEGSREMSDIFGDMLTFENPKPSGLIIELLRLAADKESLVLDFFAGSGTTAHAVLELNKLDGGSRKFILVQLPEKTNNPKYRTIADITKERVRRVIAKLDEADARKLNLEGKGKPDTGFRSFNLDSSNFKIWQADSAFESGDELTKQLNLYADNVQPDRSDQDRLFELILKSGLPLSSYVELIRLGDKQAFSIADGALVICLEPHLGRELLRELFIPSAASKRSAPKMVLCLDTAFDGNDALKTNAVLEAQSHDIIFRTV